MRVEPHSSPISGVFNDFLNIADEFSDQSRSIIAFFHNWDFFKVDFQHILTGFIDFFQRQLTI